MVFEETLGRWYLSLALYRDGDIGGTAEQVQTALAMAAEYRNLAPLSREIPCSISLCRFAFDQGICPEALAGLVRQAPPKALSMILSQVPAARAVVAATGRLTEASTLYVELLGTFRVLRAGKELDLSSARSQKVVQLLKLFAARRNAPVTREQILELVWPGSSPDAADHSFEVSLSALRKLLDTPDSNSLILRRGRGYVLNQDVPIRTDVESFQAHVERGHWWWQRGQITAALAEWQSAEQLYKGDFMEEDPYAEWAEADRERLREQYLEVLSRLGEIELGEGRCDLAVGRANKILAQDPIRETAYRLLMRAHARQGDRAVALRDYQRCVGALLKELNEEPMAETKRLADRIQQGEAV
jgi:DNA-binding SARP family transcriptional activator